MFEELPDVPPAISLIASEVALCNDSDAIRKKIVSMLPELRNQSKWFLEKQISRESDRDPGNRFEVHLHGAINPFSGDGCPDRSCRLAVADRISRSVGLIADRVWLTDYLSQQIVDCRKTDTGLIDRLVEEFLVIFRLLPLIDAGVVRFRSPLFPTSRDCIKDFEQQVSEISQSVAEAFASEFSLIAEPNQYVKVSLGNAMAPSMVWFSGEKDITKAPSVEEFVRSFVRGQINSVLWAAREASFTHGTVVSNSRVALAGLLRAEGRTFDPVSVSLLEEERNFRVPWVSDLSAAQIVELRGEAADALPRFREKLASSMAFDGVDDKRKSRNKELITELREQAAKVESELANIQKSSLRYWRNTYTLLGLGLSAYGVVTDQALAGALGLLSLVGLHIDNKSKQKKETLRLQSRPGYVLMKAKDILDHSHSEDN